MPAFAGMTRIDCGEDFLCKAREGLGEGSVPLGKSFANGEANPSPARTKACEGANLSSCNLSLKGRGDFRGMTIRFRLSRRQRFFGGLEVFSEGFRHLAVGDLALHHIQALTEIRIFREGFL